MAGRMLGERGKGGNGNKRNYVQYCNYTNIRSVVSESQKKWLLPDPAVLFALIG